MRRYLLIALLLLTSLCQAAETRIVGTVRTVTGEAIENAHICFRNTKIGTTSNADGVFYLHVELGTSAPLRITAIGYHSVQVTIEPGEQRSLDIRLAEKSNPLSEFNVTPGANPAIAILDSVRRHTPPGERTPRNYRYENDNANENENENANEDLFAHEKHLDFYRTNMPFGSISFLSPLSKVGSAYYRYYLIDSTDTHYTIDYIPRNGFDPLLQGQMVVRRTDWQLDNVTARVPYHANINHLKRLHYQADYEQGIIQRDTMIAEWQLSAWRDTTRQEDERLMRIAKWAAYAIRYGYFQTGTWLDIGPVNEALRYTDYEGLHIGLPFRINRQLLRYLTLEGYVAYGFRDEGVKWKAQLTADIPSARNHRIGFYAWDHYTYSGMENSADFATFVLRDMAGIQRLRTTTAYRRQQMRGWWSTDWTHSQGNRPGLSTRIAMDLSRHSTTTPTRGWKYNQAEFMESASIETDFTLRWYHGPEWVIRANMGSLREYGDHKPGWLYGQLSTQLSQQVHLGGAGQLQYAIIAGTNIGRHLPKQMLDPLGAYYGWTYGAKHFTMLNTPAYAHHFITAHLHWNGGGILFNRIPGIRYARLREIAFIQCGYGDSLRIPHAEAGIGIGNILGVGECYLTGRLTPSCDGEWIGFRFRAHIGI